MTHKLKDLKDKNVQFHEYKVILFKHESCKI